MERELRTVEGLVSTESRKCNCFEAEVSCSYRYYTTITIPDKSNITLKVTSEQYLKQLNLVNWIRGVVKWINNSHTISTHGCLTR